MNLLKICRTVVAISLATLGLTSQSHAQVTAFFSAGSTCSGATSATFAAGGPTVQVSLCANATSNLCGHTILLQSAANESGNFIVTARALGANYPDPNSEVSLTPSAINNPATIADFGGTVATLNPVAAATNQLLATFDLSPQASATNTSYVISLAAASAAAVDADGFCGTNIVPTDAPITASISLNRVLTPTFTSAASTTFALNVANTFNVTASGSAPITFSATGLPASVGLSSGGVLSGAPTASGTFPVTITATNGSGAAMQNFTLTVSGQATQVITFNNPGAQQFSSTPLALNATASSGLTVRFTTVTPSVCAVTSSGSLTMITVGTCTIATDQAGNVTYLAAPQAQQSFGIIGSVPGAPTIGTATPGSLQATIAFSAPAANGGSPISSYTVSCGGFTGTGNSSPITVRNLANGTPYACSVTATNSLGTGPASGTVSVTPASSALALVSVVSRKTHGTAGTFDIPIDFTIANAPGSLVSVEPRTAGAGYDIVFQFNGLVTAVGTASLSSAGTATVSTTGNNEVVVSITGIADKSRVTVSLAGVNGSASASATIGFLIGDQDGSRLVQGGDISVLRARSGQLANATNFRADLDANGFIGGGDIATARARSGNALP